MKKTILIGALLFSSISGFASDMDKCNTASRIMLLSLDKGIEAYNNKDFKVSCDYIQLANSFIEKAMVTCPIELQAKLQGAYTQGKQTEATVCNIK